MGLFEGFGGFDAGGVESFLREIDDVSKGRTLREVLVEAAEEWLLGL